MYPGCTYASGRRRVPNISVWLNLVPRQTRSAITTRLAIVRTVSSSGMGSLDDSLLDIPSGSNLLSESPLGPSHSRTGPYGDDLSLSELDQTVTYEGPGADAGPSTPTRRAVDHDDEGDDSDDPEAAEKRRRLASKRREDKLQNDLFILRKLNSTFAALSESLQEAHEAREVRS